MIGYLDKNLSHCSVNECVIMTNRELFAFAFGKDNFYYDVQFEIDENIDPKEFCAKQMFIISLQTLNKTVPYINMDPQGYEYRTTPAYSQVICVLRPSFENITTELEEAGYQWFLDETISYVQNDTEFLAMSVLSGSIYTKDFI